MKIEELEKALHLQKSAYALLLWFAKEASDLLVEEALTNAAACVPWLNRHLNQIPSDSRPKPDDVYAFALMLTSFFNTSFHLERTGVKVRLVRGRKFKDGRNRKYAQGRAELAATELTRIALKALVDEESILSPDSLVNAVLGDETLQAAVSLWSYGCELVRRSQFASQGPAVHHLWLELDEQKRRRLNAETIWKARSRLIDALRKKAAAYEH